ncbi:hypothetical protein COX75_02285 [bacterium (Candidatus Gribaldobacteria) CG_4_10_14_0_2_um_filter_33_15]|nr:MAG: hypothetical protein COU04_01730 [bacterium (Candidatus Gribaldobacteria) CG10_big_fil_rev_8_21_14_0_10_33_41]PJA00457.1 MAG: hypothetical protein COX75_02285 [bacterium (Candidatus Gribaldobacteria) CG_4_10_14_0_2_um_filter_33_15]
MKKILHLIYNLGIGGAEKMMLSTLPKISDFNHLICVINFANPKMVEEFKKQNIPTIKLKGLKIADFEKVIKNEKPDLIVTYLIYADLFGRIFGRLFGVKKIVTSIRSTYQQLKYLPFLILDCLTSFLITKYIAVSQAVKDIYVKKLKIPEEKIEIIYNGVKIEKFNIELDKNLIKEKLGIPKENFVIGNIGKLRPEKGQIYLILALTQILKEIPNTTLVLVGGGEKEKRIKELAKSFNLEKNVILLKERNDIPELLNCFDIFVNPSLYEGMSNSILEAMAAKIPIIASDIPSNRELIEDKKSGLLVPIKNSDKIAGAVIELLKNKNLRENFSQNAFLKVQSFSIEKTIKKLNDFFYQILGVKYSNNE